MIMAHFVAQTSVYRIDGRLALWLDVFAPEPSDDEAASQDSSAARRNRVQAAAHLQISWLGLGDRDELGPGELLPRARDPVMTDLQVLPQQITLQPMHLQAAYEADKRFGWRILLIQAVSGSGQGACLDQGVHAPVAASARGT
jgi:hypothetical protein